MFVSYYFYLSLPSILTLDFPLFLNSSLPLTALILSCFFFFFLAMSSFSPHYLFPRFIFHHCCWRPSKLRPFYIWSLPCKLTASLASHIQTILKCMSLIPFCWDTSISKAAYWTWPLGCLMCYLKMRPTWLHPTPIFYFF